MSKLLKFIEHDEYVVSPTNADLRLLKKLEKEKKIQLEIINKSKVKIRTSSYIGYIHLSSQRIVIKPKIPMTSVFYLISRSYAGKYVHLLRYLPSSWFDTKKEDNYEFVRIFMHIISDFVNHGLRRGYKVRQENIEYQQGALLLNENIKKPPWKKHEFYCEYDDFTYDIFPNRVIKYTIEILRRSLRDHESLITLNELQRKLIRVELEKRITIINIDKITLNRHLIHYQSVLAYCRLVIGNLSLDERMGQSSLSSFLINMNSLFESFVFQIIRIHFPNYLVRKARITLHGNMGQKDRILVTEPDVSVTNQEDLSPFFVADAKYKFLDLTKKRMDIQNDFYQILSYSLFTQSKKAILFYPRFYEEWDEPVIFPLAEYDIEVLIVNLPLGGYKWDITDTKVKHALDQIEKYLFSP